MLNSLFGTIMIFFFYSLNDLICVWKVTNTFLNFHWDDVRGLDCVSAELDVGR
jgi:hypothetical protein